MKIATDFHGVFTALVTPFKEGQVDLPSLRRLVRAQIDQGITGFVVNGTTAESPTLTQEEVKTIFLNVREETGGEVPLIVGTGSNSTAATANFSRTAEEWGADALLVVVPYYNKPPQRGLIAHFAEVASRVSIPVIAYNVPARTVTSLEPETVGEIAKIKGIIGLKEASADMRLLERIQSAVPDDFVLLSGDDGTFADFCARGGHGLIGVARPVIGKEMLATRARLAKGDKSAVKEYVETYADLIRCMYAEANPIGVKMALYWMGLIDSPELRLPLVELDPKYHQEYKTCLKKLARI
ncbi:MAG TPA: 4-hydroxy-tetrahydrodipicolinate synthase [Bdellovibrionales bacterium]|nr:4-hydroxy-tetrahydrodipicolinate synthase [Bdellovibrionales bacterium]